MPKEIKRKDSIALDIFFCGLGHNDRKKALADLAIVSKRKRWNKTVIAAAMQGIDNCIDEK